MIIDYLKLKMFIEHLERPIFHAIDQMNYSIYDQHVEFLVKGTILINRFQCENFLLFFTQFFNYTFAQHLSL